MFWIGIIVGFIFLCILMADDTHPDKKMDEEIKYLMKQIKHQLLEANLAANIDYSIKYKHNKPEKKPFDAIYLSFFDIDAKPDKWATPIAEIVNDTFVCNPVMNFDVSSFYTKPYMQFDCTLKGYEGFYIKVYMVHAARGYFKAFGEAFKKGQSKGRW